MESNIKLLGSIGLRFAAVMVFLVCSLLGEPLRAEEARIEDIIITQTRDHLVLDFRVSECFTEEMKKAIDTGINPSFTFFVRLYEVRNLWWDYKIADLKLSHDIQYDNLKKIYTVSLSERNNKVIFSQDF